MGLLSFIGLALPWLANSFFDKGANSDLLGKLSGLAHELTNTTNPKAYGTVLNDPQLLLRFQQQACLIQKEYMKSICQDRMQARRRDVWLFNKAGHNYRADKMIYIACGGLVSCLGILGICRSSLSGELVSILSAAIGVFGSCLKDAYVFEFGQGKINNNMNSDNISGYETNSENCEF